MKYKGRFGDYGGFYVPEVLIPVLEELEEAFYRFYEDRQFVAELADTCGSAMNRALSMAGC